MSFANYVRKYDVGSIRLDAPYAHFVHELPLLSFGDVLHTINLSLVYQSKMGNNQFNFMPGFGLNLHKRLVTGGTYAHAYMSGNGNSISLSASSTSGISTFKDDSQRIVRKVNGRFIVENPDYSTEEFDENDNIKLVKDKYGNKILEYTYIEGRLISIAYRPESTNKKVNIVYTEAGLPTSISYIVDNATICTTDFVHMGNGGIKVQHYSGVDYYVVSSASMFKAYSRDRDVSMDRSYYHSIECTTETDNVSKTIAVINKIGTEIENSTTYHFPKFTDDKISVVDVTDFYGVKIRTQFINDKPAYSYEIPTTPFIGDEAGRVVFNGDVSIYSNGEIAGKQTINNGLKMNKASGYNVYTQAFSESDHAAGTFIASGWVKADDENTNCPITITDSFYPEFSHEYILSDLIPDVWTFFAFTFKATNPRNLTIGINISESKLSTHDFRLTLSEPIAAFSDYHDDILRSYDVLLQKNSSGTFEIPYSMGFTFYNGDEPIARKITSKDLIKYKLNQLFGRHINEIYYDNCKGIITSAGNLNIRYTDSDGSLVVLSVIDLGVGTRYYNNSISRLSVLEIGNNSLPVVSVYQNGYVKKKLWYNQYMDIFSVKEGSLVSLYTRDPETGLILSQDQGDTSGQETITATFSYDSLKTKLLTSTDEFGVVTTYTTDPIWGVVTGVTQSNGTKTFDTFDDDFSTHLGRIFSEDTTEEREHIFNYQNGNLFSMRTGSLLYKFGYSDLGDLANVTKNNLTIETHVNNRSDKVITSTYGNYSETKRYDKYDRLTQIDEAMSNTYNINPTYDSENGFTVLTNTSYSGNPIDISCGSSKLATSTDLSSGNVTKYAYEKERLKKIGVFSSGGVEIANESFSYDDLGRNTYHSHTFDVENPKKVNSSIIYATNVNDPLADGRILSYNYHYNGNLVSCAVNGYDTFKRLKTKNVTINPQNIYFEKTYSYDKTRIEGVEEHYSSRNVGTHSYTYDASGRVTEHNYTSDNRTDRKKYTYDSLGQLIREDNLGLDKTFVYCYDNIGNITSVKTYAYTVAAIPTGTYTEKTYTYDSANKDRLTKFNGNSIIYNSLGCPQYYDNKTWTWTKGKLARIHRGSSSQPGSKYEDCKFTYDAYGRRTQKYYIYDPNPAVAGDGHYYYKTKYTYDESGRLIHEFYTEFYDTGSFIKKDLIYLYDETGIIGFVYSKNGGQASAYYYHRNLQGDVIAIYDKAGNLQAEYAYDAWGNCTIVDSTNSDIAQTNPIRYRGYYYDRETKLYYLNARYYNPEWRRFISPDSTEYLDSDVPNGLNLYAYCYNDPVNFVDPSGNLTIDVILDCYFAANSLTDLILDPSLENLGRAVLDLACLLIPLATGAGTVITKFDDIKDISSFIGKSNEAIVLGQSMNTRIIPLATTIGASFYGGLDDYLLFEKRYGSLVATIVGYSDNMVYIMMNSLSGAKFIDYGFDTSRTLSKAISKGNLLGEAISRITIYSERIFARLFRHKNVFRILERFCH